MLQVTGKRYLSRFNHEVELTSIIVYPISSVTVERYSPLGGTEAN